LKLVTTSTSPKYKAQLVARGNQQYFGFDYQERFFPVDQMVDYAFCNYEKMALLHLEVKIVFFNGVIIETVFVKQPHSFAQSSEEHLLYCLHKALYG